MAQAVRGGGRSPGVGGMNVLTRVRQLLALATDSATTEEEARTAAVQAARVIVREGIVLTLEEEPARPRPAPSAPAPEPVPAPNPEPPKPPRPSPGPIERDFWARFDAGEFDV